MSIIDRNILDLEEDFGDTEIECDCCGFSLHLDVVQYPSINQKKKDLSWITRKIDGEWKDFCSNDCYQAYLADNS